MRKTYTRSTWEMVKSTHLMATRALTECVNLGCLCITQCAPAVSVLHLPDFESSLSERGCQKAQIPVIIVSNKQTIMVQITLTLPNLQAE